MSAGRFEHPELIDDPELRIFEATGAPYASSCC
jgi:hypothetical protein